MEGTMGCEVYYIERKEGNEECDGCNFKKEENLGCGSIISKRRNCDDYYYLYLREGMWVVLTFTSKES
jgi:hypothetical protein